MQSKIKPVCRTCGDTFSIKRVRAGYKTCLVCGEAQALQDRKSWCVAPMHKSNYFLVVDRADLAGLNNKGGLVK